ncbi:hypothetical protein M427DRAFT_132559 [Gonapodya prolifera JEL478]|uniref:BTB domain-containing protein n=1 Tax=Gonapodya prolifera (strain JEL478) TaxID=1344416 RepID=A0A139AQ19_GONPJ|nr:hypothetical protein M427DRAFT_132559 [Gonapodya prolifera JEL478]|eukprot:KXS18603.1 hypothetical protein M427DRAFT_132559 [Gonapodya prolifera JEL478]
MPGSLSGLLPFLKEGTFADALLQIKTTEEKSSSLPIHRIVLAYRSPYFYDLFASTQPTMSSKGLPIYQTPVLPAHPSLHEVLGLCLWWIYSLDEHELTLPDTKWDQVVGIHRISDLFQLGTLFDYSTHLLHSAIDQQSTLPDDLFTIAKEGRIWGCPDIEHRAMDALLSVVVSSDATDATLAATSYDTFASILDHADLVKNYGLVQRFVDAKFKAGRQLSLDQTNALWARVPFNQSEVEPQAPEVPAPKAPPLPDFMDNPAALLAMTPDAFRQLMKQVTTPNATGAVSLRAPEAYGVIRGYVLNHPEIDDRSKLELWLLVRFVELSVEELERAFAEAIAPQDMMLKAMFSKLSLPPPTVGPPTQRPLPPFYDPSPPPSPHPPHQGAAGHEAPISKSDLDWTALIKSKQVDHWEDLTLNVTKRQMDDVVASWSALKRDGLVEEFARLTKECLFTENPEYEKLFPSPDAFPFVKIIDTVATQTHRSLGRNQREVVADLMLIGNMHWTRLRLSINDYKAMTVSVVYAMTAVHGNVSTEQKAREVYAWQVLLSEMSAIMYRGEKMTEQERLALMRAVHGEAPGPKPQGGNSRMSWDGARPRPPKGGADVNKKCKVM